VGGSGGSGGNPGPETGALRAAWDGGGREGPAADDGGPLVIYVRNKMRLFVYNYSFLSFTTMAKKNKDGEAPNANSIVNKDIMQRLNFMYQASVYLSGVLPAPPQTTAATPQKRTKKSRKMTVHDLSKSYINSMKTVASKTMVKMWWRFVIRIPALLKPISGILPSNELSATDAT
jgi:hypothetical protein